MRLYINRHFTEDLSCNLCLHLNYFSGPNLYGNSALTPSLVANKPVTTPLIPGAVCKVLLDQTFPTAEALSLIMCLYSVFTQTSPHFALLLLPFFAGLIWPGKHPQLIPTVNTISPFRNFMPYTIAPDGTKREIRLSPQPHEAFHHTGFN